MRPSAAFTSLGFTPAARTSISIWSPAGTGESISRTRASSDSMSAAGVSKRMLRMMISVMAGWRAARQAGACSG